MKDKRLEMKLQHTHAEVNVQLQSKVDAMEAAEDAAALAEAGDVLKNLKNVKKKPFNAFQKAPGIARPKGRRRCGMLDVLPSGARQLRPTCLGQGA